MTACDADAAAVTLLSVLVFVLSAVVIALVYFLNHWHGDSTNGR